MASQGQIEEEFLRDLEAQRGYDMLRTPYQQAGQGHLVIDDRLPEGTELDEVFKDAVADLLHAAERAGLTVETVCVEALKYVYCVRDEIEYSKSLNEGDGLAGEDPYTKDKRDLRALSMMRALAQAQGYAVEPCADGDECLARVRSCGANLATPLMRAPWVDGPK